MVAAFQDDSPKICVAIRIRPIFNRQNLLRRFGFQLFVSSVRAEPVEALLTEEPFDFAQGERTLRQAQGERKNWLTSG
jgi:hypothetical protein